MSEAETKPETEIQQPAQQPTLTTEEFLKLVGDINLNETFDVVFSDNTTHKFKQLTSNHLKDLVKTIVDSPLTQVEFNTTLFKIMQKSSVNDKETFLSKNVLDRLLFCIATRAYSLSETFTIVKEDDTKFVVNLATISEKLNKFITEKAESLKDKTQTKNTITVTYGIPSLKVDTQVNNEFYKNKNFDVENTDELRKVLGETFITEIAKCLKTASINDKQINFNDLSFNERLKILETLPASLTQQIIEYIEEYKKNLEECLRVTEDVILPVDGSLFTSR